MKENIKITCYDKEEIWDSREKAEAFYLDCMMNSEGSEQQRYANIYMQLKAGLNVCNDEEDDF